MSQHSISIIAIASPVLFILLAIASWFQSGIRPKAIIAMSKVFTSINILIALVSCFYVYQYNLIQSGFIGIKNLGLSLRLDSVSAIMLLMISLLGFIIIKFSINYLDGDSRQGAFIGRLAATIASVELLVLSANLGLLFIAWVLTSVCLHRLLLFYNDRPVARVVAKKKFILARLGDLCLLLAVILLYNHFGTGDLETIFIQVKQSGGTIAFSGLEVPALFLGLAAIFKSAQFPTHGWLIEVMETPTPVSALLHAGLLNAGPFLIIRMAFLIDVSSSTPILLLIIGGITALFASVVYLTQTSVKTALGYSSIGHMGFSLMLCGLGVYSAALLHLVAHSFYKAHSFLSSGSGIDALKASRITKEPKKERPVKVVVGILMALSLYAIFAYAWGLDFQNDFSLLLIGAVIVMGLSRIFTSALSTKWNSGLVAQAGLIGLLVATAFFVLESGTDFLLHSEIPEPTMPGPGKMITAIIIFAIFGIAVLIQIIAPQLSSKPFYRKLAIHVRNGFYTNAIFDRLISALRIHSPKNKLNPATSSSPEAKPEKSKIKELEEQVAS